MPKHEWTFICDEFVTTETGVFSIIGCFHDLLFEGFPGKIEKFTIVSSFIGDKGETFKYWIRFFDPNLKRTIESIPVSITCTAERFGGFNATIRQPLDGLIVNSTDTIIFEIIINGVVVHKDALYIQTI